MTFDFNSHSHRRFNPLLNSWVMVAPHRTQRPWQGAQETAGDDYLPVHDPQCYLCPRNKRAKGDINPDYKTTFIFENDYAAVKQDQPDLPFTPINEAEVEKGGSCSRKARLRTRQTLATASCTRSYWNCASHLLQSSSHYVFLSLLDFTTKFKYSGTHVTETHHPCSRSMD